MKFTVLTLFPDLIEAWANTGLVGQAVRKSLVQVRTQNPHEFATDNHKTVDDTAFGGSDGMVIKFEPMAKAIEGHVDAHVVFLSPQGKPWNQERAMAWQKTQKNIVLVCGRYAGFDQRLIETYADEEVSIGDYILNGGEVAALAVMESVIRLVPGVLGNQTSAHRESFTEGLLEAPVFTRPRETNGMPVPAPLLSGNHAEIARFERDVSLVRTKILRPDLIEKFDAKGEWRSSVKRIRTLNAAELKALGLSEAQLMALESQR